MLKTVAASALVALSAFLNCENALAVTLLGQFNGSKYYVTDKASTWTNAQAEAQGLGGNLVTINDQAEQNWLLSVVGDYNPSGGVNGNRFWIGLTDQKTEGVFEWISGEISNYTNWFAGEPNSGFGGYEEDYVAMNWLATGGNWNDLPNSGPGFSPTLGIIETKLPLPESTPEPGALMSFLLLGAMGSQAINRRRSVTKDL